MRRSYVFRMRPTARQHVALSACLSSHRELYNAALQERRDAWKLRRVGISYKAQSAQLRDIRDLRPDIAQWSFSSQQATLRRLNKAFAAFFRRVKSGEKPGYPRFKAAHRFNSVEWPKDGDGCRWKPEASRVYLQGIGHVKVTAHRKVEGVVKTVTVKRAGNKWYLVLSCDKVPTKTLPPTGREVGVDVGVATFAATSKGDLINNPAHREKAAARLTRAQQVLSRKQRGSNNRRAAREVVASRYRKIANARCDFHHKVARKLVEAYDVIVLEDLSISNMVKRPKPVSDPEDSQKFLPNGAAAKAGLNKSIYDAGWGQFAKVIVDKAEEAGRQVIFVDPRNTSSTCAHCGHTARENRVSQAEFRCRSCGHTDHADVNAAINILRAGLALPVASAA